MLVCVILVLKYSGIIFARTHENLQSNDYTTVLIRFVGVFILPLALTGEDKSSYKGSNM